MIRLKPSLLFCCAISFAITLSGCGGSSGNSVQSASFTLSASPSSMTLAQGGRGTSTITITPVNGFNGTVSLSASGLPSGVSASFDPSSATTTSTLTLTASATAAAGTVTATIVGTSNGSTNTTPLGLTVNAENGQIKHVVIIFQENRTPDNLFQDPTLISRGANIQNYGYTSTGTKVTLTPVSLVTTYDLGHGHSDFLSTCQWNGSQCAMDGSNLEPCTGSGCPTNAAYQYVQLSDTGYSLQPYYTMAETYAFGDNMFQTNEGPSFPAHQYILSGTSAISTSSTTYVADNPSDNARPDGSYWAGCLAPPASILNTIDVSQPFPNSNITQITGTLSECFEHPTLTDVLDQAGLSWKYYAASPGDIWTAPNAIQHMCDPTSADGEYDDTVCSGNDWTNANPNVVIEGSGAQVITDIGNCELSSVTWVVPDGQNSDHAAGNTGGGPSWVASIVNAIGNNPACPGTNEIFWNDTAIIVSWDDWGGWFDHVAPPIRNSDSYPNSYEYGFRVPIIVISPYAKPAYVSHQLNDFGSILLFIENTFNLGQINPSVGYADSYALGDLSDFFDFSQTPLKFTTIQSDHDAEFFINSKAKPTPPDND